MYKFRELLVADLKNLFSVRWLWLYMAILAFMNLLILYLSSDVSKVILSVLNITLLIVPLVNSLFGLTYFYDSKSFMEFLLSQPVSRGHVFWSKITSVGTFLCMLYLVGVSVPLLKEGVIFSLQAVMLLVSGIFLNLIFVCLAFLIGVLVDDRIRGVSLMLGLWLYLSLLHDGVILGVIYLLREYPVDKLVLVMSFVNPVDLARISVVVNTDVAALMGLSETLFRKVLGSLTGTMMALGALTLWIVLPATGAYYFFKKKDL